jgi:hypothetical protein
MYLPPWARTHCICSSPLSHYIIGIALFQVYCIYQSADVLITIPLISVCAFRPHAYVEQDLDIYTSTIIYINILLSLNIFLY